MKRAKVALARKLASVLHRMWLDGTGFRFGRRSPSRDRLRRRKSAQAELLRRGPVAGTRDPKPLIRECLARCENHAPLDWLAAPFLMA